MNKLIAFFIVTLLLISVVGSWRGWLRLGAGHTRTDPNR